MSLRLAIAAAALVAVPASAAFHNKLEKSVPAADATVASPKEVRLWFTEKVEARFSSISLTKPDSSKVELGKAHATDDAKSIAADVPATLAPGSYTVTWRTAGDDGHAVRGRFAFTVR